MGFEDNFLKNVDRHRAQDRAERRDNVGNSIEAIIPREYDAAVKYNKESAIWLKSFEDLYGPETIQRDIAEVNRLKRSFSNADSKEYHSGLTFEDVRKLSEISESYLLRGINESNWIPFCTAIKTSDYDDYKNGLDLVLEYQKGDDKASHMGLGIDITFASTIDKKLKRIKDDIEAGTLSSIKYFDSPKSHIRGELRRVPRGIVSMDLETIDRLAATRQQNGSFSQNDPMRVLALHELNMQFKTFWSYAKQINSPSLETLKYTANFVDLLSNYAQQKSPNHSNILFGSESVKRLSRRLEVFDTL